MSDLKQRNASPSSSKSDEEKPTDKTVQMETKSSKKIPSMESSLIRRLSGNEFIKRIRHSLTRIFESTDDKNMQRSGEGSSMSTEDNPPSSVPLQTEVGFNVGEASCSGYGKRITRTNSPLRRTEKILQISDVDEKSESQELLPVEISQFFGLTVSTRSSLDEGIIFMAPVGEDINIQKENVNVSGSTERAIVEDTEALPVAPQRRVDDSSEPSSSGYRPVPQVNELNRDESVASSTEHSASISVSGGSTGGRSDRTLDFPVKNGCSRSESVQGGNQIWNVGGRLQNVDGNRAFNLLESDITDNLRQNLDSSGKRRDVENLPSSTQSMTYSDLSDLSTDDISSSVSHADADIPRGRRNLSSLFPARRILKSESLDDEFSNVSRENVAGSFFRMSSSAANLRTFNFGYKNKTEGGSEEQADLTAKKDDDNSDSCM